MNLKLKKIHSGALVPEYKTIHSAGADLYACLDEDMVMKPQEIKLVPTGLVMEIPEGFEVQIRPRSGFASKGISIPNAPGTIDSDYRGEVKVILINLSQQDFVIKNHDRIAQMVMAKVEQASFVVVEEVTETVRGTGGFGSTGTGR